MIYKPLSATFKIKFSIGIAIIVAVCNIVLLVRLPHTTCNHILRLDVVYFEHFLPLIHVTTVFLFAGVAAITVQFSSLLFIAIALLYNFM